MLTRTYIFDRYVDAKGAVSALEQAAISPYFISILGRGGDDLVTLSEYQPETRMAQEDPASLLDSLGLTMISDMGPLAVGGWLAAGTHARGTTGDAVVETLVASGHSQDDAEVFAEALHRGATLVAVRAKDHQIDGVAAMLVRDGGVDAATRGAAYLADGWTGYDSDALPYTSQKVYDERMRYTAHAA